jgi:sialate O-acetylesterase
MQLLINGWRSAWNDQTLPFYYTQIVPYLYSKMPSTKVITPETEARFWESQAQVMNIPNTGMIVTNDLNDDVKNLHPLYKWEIGRRLALVALAKTYKKQVVYSGPVYRDMKISGSKIALTFADVAGGLISNDNKPLTWFTIAGADGKFVAADAEIKGDKVIVSAKDITKPTAVRFAWNEAAQPNLFNKSGLPARPFRTDSALKIDLTDK